MTYASIKKALSRSSVVTVVFAALSGCGGGSGDSRIISSPPPAPQPSPTPAPSPGPTPPPASSFDTIEYRRSDGPLSHGAITAWEAGATGSGSIISVIDTGIDLDSPEFAGRIHPGSRDVAGTRSVDAVDDHGTHVSLVAAAAHDGSGIMGVAFDAQILALRADRPGTCSSSAEPSPTLECSFAYEDIARGIDIAIAEGATVINVSLGGPAANEELLASVRRAADAGVVIVVAAGNYGAGDVDEFDPLEPTPFAATLRKAGSGNVLIVGSVDEFGEISDFSNRAGQESAFFLTARGEALCCVYEDGAIFTTGSPPNQFSYLFAGTSFSAPQVAGAIALLRQAFPNLSANELVSLVLETARDVGAQGEDGIYGQGILDIAQAFQPVGGLQIAGSERQVVPGWVTAVGSPAMGDAVAGIESLASVATDKYDRAFRVDLAGGFTNFPFNREVLRPSIESTSRRLGSEGETMAMAFTVADRAKDRFSRNSVGLLKLPAIQAEGARVLAGRIVARLSSEARLALGVSENGHRLVAYLKGDNSADFLVAAHGRGDLPFLVQDQSVAALHWKNPWLGMTVSFESGKVMLGAGDTSHRSVHAHGKRSQFRKYSIDFDKDLGQFKAGAGLEVLDESNTIFGGWFGGPLGGSGSQTTSLAGWAMYQPNANWRVSGTWQRGRTSAKTAGMISAGSTLVSKSWAFDVLRKGIFSQEATIGLRLSQPLRVQSGGLRLTIPVSYDYELEAPLFSERTISLSPNGRERTAELRWGGRIGGGAASAGLYYRHQPNHVADSQADAGLSASFSMVF